MNWTKEHIEQLQKQGKIRGYTLAGEKRARETKSKYGNQKVELDGCVFDSKKESRRYLVLREELLTGDITELEVHVEFPLIVEGKLIGSYICDFRYKRKGKLVVEDVKSKVTRRIEKYRLKKKLMKAIYNIEIIEV